jgi:hypothetical protein
MVDKLDKEFNDLKSQVRQKMESAAKLLAEADELVKASGLKGEATERDYDDGIISYKDDADDETQVAPLRTYHYEMYDAMRPLMNALSVAGWSASSMRC